MTRSTMWLMLLFTLSGCDRQVNINEALEAGAGSLDTVNSVGSSPTVSPTNTTPEILSDPQVPAVVDTSNNPEQSNIRLVSVRVPQPDLLTAAAGLVSFTPVLVSSDGSRTAMSCCDADGAWTSNLQLDANGQWSGVVEWHTSVGDTDVTVLEGGVQLNNPSGDGIEINPTNYQRTTDADGDGVENLTEIIAGTNPSSADDVSEAFLDARVRIPRVPSSEAPIIDGRAGEYESGTTRFSGEWAAAAHLDVDGNRLSIDNLMFATPGFATDAENHHWLALHDGTWLYLLVVIDDAGIHHFDSREVAKPWRDDSIEVFVDGDNSQAPMYDQVDDFSMHLVTLNADASGSNSSTDANPNIFRSVNSVPLPAGIVFSTGPTQGPSAPSNFVSSGVNQDVYEIALRISDLNIELGRTFGFEVQFDDDDDAGDRDAKWGWAHPAGNSSDNDFTWRDPSYMGRVVLLP